MGFSLVWLYAGCMLITGSVNTISTKYQDMTVERMQADGSPVYFQHPALQSAMMFSGEALCLIPYFLLRWRKRTIRAQQGTLNTKPPMPRLFVLKRVAAFAIPTLCDATATTLLNIGLFYTFASTFQMLRGTLVLFAGCLTILILRRRLYLHHWLGMVLIAAGAAIVGFASVVQSNRHYPPHHHHSSPPPAMGPAEESVLEFGLQQRGAHDLGEEGLDAGMLPEADVPLTGRSLLDSHWLVQGLHTLRKGGSSSSSSTDRWSSDLGGLNGEGSGGGWLRAGAPVLPIVGDTLVVLAQLFAAAQFVLEEKFLAKYRMQPLLAVGVEGAWGVVLSLCALPVLGRMQAPNGLPLEDASAAFEAMARLPDLRNAVILSVVSIGAFNWFGLSVTQALSGASRATIDACRTMLVWFFSLAAGWETFHELQVLGFVVLISGTSLYNELLRSCLPPPASAEETDEDDVEQGESYNLVNGAYNALPSGPDGPGEASRLAGPARPPRGRAQGGRQPSRSQDIRSTASRAPPHHHRNILARSMRLGYNVLSPHSLGDDPEGESSEGDEEGEGGNMQHEGGGRRRGVLHPMDLASTPFPDGSFLLQLCTSMLQLSYPQRQAQLCNPFRSYPSSYSTSSTAAGLDGCPVALQGVLTSRHTWAAGSGRTPCRSWKGWRRGKWQWGSRARGMRAGVRVGVRMEVAAAVALEMLMRMQLRDCGGDVERKNYALVLDQVPHGSALAYLFHAIYPNINTGHWKSCPVLLVLGTHPACFVFEAYQMCCKQGLWGARRSSHNSTNGSNLFVPMLSFAFWSWGSSGLL